MSVGQLDSVLILAFVAAFGLGGIVGLGELVARYRDEPTKAILSLPAVVYISVNAAASVLALWAARLFGWTFGATSDERALGLQVLVAGFGAMALFRTSLFVVRAGNTDIGIGPIAFLQVILGASDRGVDRRRAADRAPLVSRIMAGLRYDEVNVALPSYALQLMQNVSTEDQDRLGDQVRKLTAAAMSDRFKVLNLGLLMLNVVGEDVLEAAVATIRGEQTPSEQPQHSERVGNSEAAPRPPGASSPGAPAGGGNGSAGDTPS